MRKKKKPGLNFYSRKGAAFTTLKSTTLFFPWLVITYLILEVLRLYYIVFGMSTDMLYAPHTMKRHLLFGLDMMGTFQMVALLLAGYIFVHLGVFVTEQHKSRRTFFIGIALHIFGIVTAILYVLAYGMYIPWLENLP